MCNEDYKKEALTQIISLNIQYRIGECSTSDEVLTKLLKLKYNPRTSFKYLDILVSIKQDHYLTIDIFIKEITDNARKLKICYDWIENLISAKIHESFYNGLNSKVKIQMKKYTVHTRK
ncbi:hypothetical protein EQH57_0277 [Dictyocoela roeselum]|nr:hypothetical protein EQH57_0277 [Dictyocoela roeselum]